MRILIEQHEPDDMELHKERLIVNDKIVYSVAPLWYCPEDACIGRDLEPATKFAELMKTAYEAGITGESLDIEIKIIDEW